MDYVPAKKKRSGGSGKTFHHAPRPQMQHDPDGRINGKKIIKNISIIFIIFIVFSLLFLTGRWLWREKRWRYIIIHHTASDAGNLEYFRRLHREERGWSDIAYHFVINNGTSNTSMGQIEESSLWANRLPHFSTRISYLNYFGIAIVLVGNFEKHEVPPVQKEALINLIVNLSIKYNIPPERVVGHREVSPTACPGKYLNMAELRSEVAQVLERLR